MNIQCEILQQTVNLKGGHKMMETKVFNFYRLNFLKIIPKSFSLAFTRQGTLSIFYSFYNYPFLILR